MLVTGKLSFQSYWARTILKIMRDFDGPITVQELSEKSFIFEYDIVETLADLVMIKYVREKPKVIATPELAQEGLEQFNEPRLIFDQSQLRFNPPERASALVPKSKKRAKKSSSTN